MAAERKRPRRRKRPPIWRLIVRWGLILGALFAITGLAVFAYAYQNVDIPDPNEFVNGQATIITYADGTELGRIGAQNRISVPLAEIPLHTRRAVMAAENASFYTDRAISPTGIARALLNNLRGGSLQGGSTITQQYAKTAFLDPSRTIQRKLKELIISIKLEQRLSKDEILADYLNTIYFGRGAYGINTAAQSYFGVDAAELNVAQSAVLASILRAPGRYDPGFDEKNKPRLEARFKYVLGQMAASDWLSESDAESIQLPEVKPRSVSGRYQGPKGFLITAVQKELERIGFTEAQLLAGGIKIRTTFEKKAQEAAVEAVKTQGPKTGPADLRIGLAAITPGTGAVVAMYGGADYLVRSLNDATQSITQAGSTFKPFALVAGLEQGISLNSRWNGASPQTFDDSGRPYRVQNYGNRSFGKISLLTATASSVNTVYVPLGIKTTPQAVADAARRAGIPDSVKIDPTPSVVLGTSSPRVIDIANAYATFAAQGVYAKPYMVLDVESRNGGVLYQASPQSQQVFEKDVMADLSFALQTVVTGGSGFEARKLGRPSAGKTGTSQSNASAWYTGYTPQLSVSVALFRDDSTLSLRGTGGLSTVTGGSFPARIWTAFMKEALKGKPVIAFPPRANIGASIPQEPPVETVPPPTEEPPDDELPVSPSPTRTPTPTPTPTVTTTTRPPTVSPTPTPTPTPTTTPR
jgi:membrane peptidoglycan carboxypeptidase